MLGENASTMPFCTSITNVAHGDPLRLVSIDSHRRRRNAATESVSGYSPDCEGAFVGCDHADDDGRTTWPTPSLTPAAHSASPPPPPWRSSRSAFAGFCGGRSARRLRHAQQSWHSGVRDSMQARSSTETRRALVTQRARRRHLARGRSGWAVRELQLALAWHGFPSGTIDATSAHALLVQCGGSSAGRLAPTCVPGPRRSRS